MKSKIIYIKRSCITLIVLWFISPLLFGVFQIDFATTDYLRIYKELWLYLLPIAILTLFVVSWKGKSNYSIKAFSYIAIIISTYCIVYLFNLVSGMCARSFSEPKFIHKHEQRELKLMNLNCGAWDSDPPLNELVEKHYISKYLIFYRKMDAENLNMSVWEKVN